jgi:hypothetical protein
LRAVPSTPGGGCRAGCEILHEPAPVLPHARLQVARHEALGPGVRRDDGRVSDSTAPHDGRPCRMDSQEFRISGVPTIEPANVRPVTSSPSRRPGERRGPAPFARHRHTRAPAAARETQLAAACRCISLDSVPGVGL